jgi:ferredoxin
MTRCPGPQTAKMNGIWFAAGLTFAATVAVVTLQDWPVRSWMILWVGLLLVALRYRSLALMFEVFVIAWLGRMPFGSDPARHVALVTAVLVLMGYGSSRLTRALAAPATVAWFGIAVAIPGGYSPYGWIVLGCAAATLALSGPGRRQPAVTPRHVDIVVDSASGNTMHLARSFIDGLRRAGAAATVHRFHYFRDFRAELAGDALVVAFPVYGFKPPWPFLVWLLRDLPRGRRRPAFVLYSCGGGPENAGPLVWLLLRLKGWRTGGRLWAVYPINVVTFRLGPRALWRFLDRLVPLRWDAVSAASHGAAFARGRVAGFPYLVWPLPLFLIGILLDNKWLDTLLYRNRAWRRRCNGCGICARYCPAQRLTMIDGLPRARGTCTLCLGCVNLCPRHAMHLLGWTEYGQPYRPRWPELTVRSTEESGVASKES